jgi:type II secretory pathway pseudopilin PulG
MKPRRKKSGQEGYVLLALMLAVTLILIALSVEAPRIAQQIKREREEELVHRGKDYATAVKRFVHKNGGRYPASIEQLEDTNHVRFLRKRYKDPITGEDNWRLVRQGEAQIKIPTPNPGLNSNTSGPTGSLNTSPLGGGPAPSPTPGNNPGGLQNQQTQQQGNNSLGTLNTSGIGSGGQPVGGGQIIGVASASKKQSIKEFNDKDHYNDWFFVYDLRLEQSGGTGVTVAEPRAGSGGGDSGGQSGQGPQPGGTAAPTPVGTPAPTPPPVPN